MSGTVRGGSGPSLDEGKNNSREAVPAENRQSRLSEHRDSEGTDRYDCREVYSNLEHEAEDGSTAPFRCSSWDCYCCAHRMRHNLIEELERLVEERPDLRRFLTLTLDPSRTPDDPARRHRYLTERFNALRTVLTDRYDGLSYVWFREEQESGNPHLHLLVDRFLPQAEVSALAARAGMGEIVDIRRVDARNAAKYATKYLTKGAMAELPEGVHRYGSSADLDLDVRDGGGDDRDWTLLMDDLQVTTDDGDPLRRRVAREDFVLQRQWGGPVPPPS